MATTPSKWGSSEGWVNGLPGWTPPDPTVAGSWYPQGMDAAQGNQWIYSSVNPGMAYNEAAGTMAQWMPPSDPNHLQQADDQGNINTPYGPQSGYTPGAYYSTVVSGESPGGYAYIETPIQQGYWSPFQGNPTNLTQTALEGLARYGTPDSGLFDPRVVVGGLGMIAGLAGLPTMAANALGVPAAAAPYAGSAGMAALTGGDPVRAVLMTGAGDLASSAFSSGAPEVTGLEPTVADLTSGAMLPQSSGALSTLPTAVAATDTPIQLAEAGLSDAPPAYAQTLSTGANTVDPLTYLTEDPMQSIVNADPSLSALAPSPTYSLPEGDYYTPDYAFSGSPTGTPHGNAPIGGPESEMLPLDIAREVIPSPTIPNVPGMGDIYAPSMLSALKAVWGTTKDVATVSALIKSLGLTGNAALKLLQQVTGQTQASPLRGALSLLGAGSMLALMNSKPGRPAAAIPGGTSAQGALGRVGFAAPRAANTSRLFAQGYARGGSLADRKRAFFNYVRGSGGGQDDTVQANLSPGEYVMDAETVSSLGDGNNEAGAAKLDRFRQAVRQHKRTGPLSDIPPKAKPIEHYLKG